MKVTVIGGGIAGLSCALSLHQVGIACQVYEAVPSLAPLGYGINLQPNAVRELSALGLGGQLAAAGILTKELAFYNKHGQLIWLEPRGKDAGYRWPQISIARSALHEVLLSAIRQRLGAEAVVTGHRLSALEQRGSRVIGQFVGPAGEPIGETESDLLVGADGIHSAVRQHFYPGEKAVFDGYLHYRGLVEYPRFLTGGTMAVIGHRYHRAIIYPVAHQPNGQVVTNWLAYTRIPSGSPPLEAWDTAADKQACLDQYQGWTFPWLDVQGLFAATPAERVLQLPNVDRDPIPCWSFDRVTLIGDAAHPMHPVGAQAGSQAVVDGRVLAASLMATRDPVEALRRYQDERIVAMNDMIIRNRNLGLESVLQTAEERAPFGFTHIYDVLSREELETTALNFKKAAGLDVQTVNSRESFIDLAAAR
jgi:2-polyprenyl-6-methoxyphenol hydroxylase-like FAD-dependent oxidoreductase